MSNTNFDDVNEKMQVMKKKRAEFMRPFESNAVLYSTIPEITAKVIHKTFGLNVDTYKEVIPITFVNGWINTLKYMAEQPLDEYSISTPGVTIEYVTDFSESDKYKNIVPQMRHNKHVLFPATQNNTTEAMNFKQKLNVKVTSWRDTNSAEILQSVENSTYSTVLSDFGVGLVTPGIVTVIMGCVYETALQLIEQSPVDVNTGRHVSINLYNIFTVTMTSDKKIIITPSSVVKQYLKNDSGNC